MQAFLKSFFTLLILVVVLGLMGMSSCEKDGDSDNPPTTENENNGSSDTVTLDAGSYEATVTGALEESLSGGVAVFSDTLASSPDADTGVMVILEDSASNHRIQTKIFKSEPVRVGEGSYPVGRNLRSSNVNARSEIQFFPGASRSNYSSYDESNGEVVVTSRSDTSLSGKIKDVQLINFLNDETVSINGEFHAVLLK